MKKYILTIHTCILALVLATGISASALSRDEREFASGFSINKSSLVIDDGLESLGRKVADWHKAGRLERFDVCGYSSPDGPYAFNARLAADRAEAVCRYFNRYWGIPVSLINVSNVAEDWDTTRGLIAAGDIGDKDSILAIIDNEPDGDRREAKLRSYAGGNAWRRLAAEVFPQVRRARIVVVTDDGELEAVLTDEGTTIETVEQPVVEEPVAEQPGAEPVAEVPVATDTVPAATELPEWQRHAYLKTNVPAWFLLWINLAGEYDISRHWSVNLSIYYSGFDYFQRTRKYRTFTLMPELRYWFRPDNQGFFVAPHFGLGWYNVAFEGAYRYQDHDGRTPAIGGGVNAGFRCNISRNKRWRLECSVGFGIYALDYDMFVNKANGLLAGRKKRTFYGIDNAALSVCYMFDVRKKGGRK